MAVPGGSSLFYLGCNGAGLVQAEEDPLQQREPSRFAFPSTCHCWSPFKGHATLPCPPQARDGQTRCRGRSHREGWHWAPRHSRNTPRGWPGRAGCGPSGQVLPRCPQVTQGSYWPPHRDGGGEQPVTVPAPRAAELRPVLPTGTSPWGEQIQGALHSTSATWHTRALPALGTASGPKGKTTAAVNLSSGCSLSPETS